MLDHFFQQVAAYTTDMGNVSWEQIVTTLFLSMILSLFICFIYIKTFKGRYYSQTFVHTVFIVCVVISMIILVIGTNIARAFGLAGALSIIRFRSSIRDPKDVAFIFFAMATGLAVGSGYYVPAIIFVVMMCTVIVILSLLNFAQRIYKSKLLRIIMPESLNHEDIFNDLFEIYLTSQNLISVKTTNLGTLFEVVYSISEKPGISEKEFIDDIRSRNGNLNVSIALDQQMNDFY